MVKDASDLILRIRAGPGYDQENLQVVNVNDEANPILIDSEHFTGYLVVRMHNFNGMTPENKQPIRNPPSNYFKGHHRRYSIMVQGRWKKAWNGDEIIFGIDADQRIEHPGVNLESKLPNAQVVLFRQPKVSIKNKLLTLTPTPSPQTTLAVGHSTPPIPDSTGLLFDAPNAPSLPSYEKRKRHFADPAARRAAQIHTENIYAMDFYDGYFDFNAVCLRLPGFSVNALKYYDGQPLRFVCRTRDRSVTFLLCILNCWEREALGLLGEAEEKVENGGEGGNEGFFARSSTTP
ncbi:hypothetical protein BC829DRAFT_443177 [Chytridium lagenaria]|nr:hypothetical protein BC829DRAFT_443177 [Chytridium lagenaria]